MLGTGTLAKERKNSQDTSRISKVLLEGIGVVV